MVDATHQLATVLASEIVVVGALKAEEIALLLVGHTKHEAGQVFIRMFTTDLLVDDEAILVKATVENHKLLHPAQFRLRDVECNFIVTVFLGHAFGEESLPLLRIALRKQF